MRRLTLIPKSSPICTITSHVIWTTFQMTCSCFPLSKLPKVTFKGR